jgi:hypothetical protein
MSFVLADTIPSQAGYFPPSGLKAQDTNNAFLFLYLLQVFSSLKLLEGEGKDKVLR